MRKRTKSHQCSLFTRIKPKEKHTTVALFLHLNDVEVATRNMPFLSIAVCLTQGAKVHSLLAVNKCTGSRPPHTAGLNSSASPSKASWTPDGHQVDTYEIWSLLMSRNPKLGATAGGTVLLGSPRSWGKVVSARAYSAAFGSTSSWIHCAGLCPARA